MLPHVCSYFTNSTDENGLTEKIKVNESIDVIEQMSFSGEHDIFHAQCVIDMLEFKWDTYGFNFHTIGFVSVASQVILLVIYTQNIYLKDGLYEYVESDDPDIIGGFERVPKSGNNDNTQNYQAMFLFIGLIYPLIYVFILISKIGLIKVITEPHNVDSRVYVYVMYLAISVFTVLWHRTYDP